MTDIDPYYSTVAAIHGILGLIIFITGILQFALKKGGKLHQYIGYTYLIAWVGILITGYYIGSIVIVAIVLLGFYLSVTGIRAAVLKGNPFTAIDKIIVGVAGTIVLFLIYATIALIIKQNYSFAIISSFFALLYLFVVGRDVLHYIFNKKVFKNDYGKMNWYVNHLSRMQFSYITAIGAFTAVQQVFHNTVLDFILPAVIGIIVVNRSIAYFKKKSNIKPIEI